MTHRHIGSTALLGTVLAFASAAPLVHAFGEGGQAADPAPKKASAAPRTPWGHPDLQGIWTNQTITPLERPRDLTGKDVLTPEEAAELERQTRARRNQDSRAGAGTTADVARAYNQFWWDQGTAVVPTLRTSLVIDPPDGRIPWTPAGREHNARSGARYGVGPYDSWLDLDTGERCLTDGLPMVPGAYNNNFQILQTPDYVVILHEMYRDRRIVPLDGRPRNHLPQWLGEARGRWEGSTLVIETTGFADKTGYWWAASWRASSPTLRLTERLTRVSGDTIDYRFTVEDPARFTAPWTAAVPMTTNQAARGVTEGRLYEFACHEGNYSLVNILSGARSREQAEEAKKNK
jgi:hypothetical protein